MRSCLRTQSRLRKKCDSPIIFFSPRYVLFLSLFQYRENEVIRLCMKQFRLLNYQNVFNHLLEATKVKLEDSLLSELFDLLVLKGDFHTCESFIENAISGACRNPCLLSYERPYNVFKKKFVYSIKLLLAIFRNKITTLLSPWT